MTLRNNDNIMQRIIKTFEAYFGRFTTLHYF